MSTLTSLGQVYGTAVIGKPLRQETEVRAGELISMDSAVPGGTVGKTFVSNFRHESFSSLAALPSGVVVQGSFTVTVLSSSDIRLSSPSVNLWPGRYEYDISSTDGLGNVSTSSLREFVLLGSLTGGASSPLPPVDTLGQQIQLAINQHNASVSAHSGLAVGGSGAASFEVQITESQLSIDGLFVTANQLPTLPSSVNVYDSQGIKVLQADTSVSLASIVVDLADFRPLAGVWLMAVVN